MVVVSHTVDGPYMVAIFQLTHFSSDKKNESCDEDEMISKSKSRL